MDVMAKEVKEMKVMKVDEVDDDNLKSKGTR